MFVLGGPPLVWWRSSAAQRNDHATIRVSDGLDEEATQIGPGFFPPPQPESTVWAATEDPSPVPPTHRRGDTRSLRRAGGHLQVRRGRLHPRLLLSRQPPLALRAISPTAWWRTSGSPARTFTQIVDTANTFKAGIVAFRRRGLRSAAQTERCRSRWCAVL